MTSQEEKIMKKLSPKQAEVLKVIGKYIGYHGFAPTYREIVELTSIYDHKGVSRILTVLMEKGYVTHQFHKPRTIRIIQLTPDLMTPENWRTLVSGSTSNVESEETTIK